MQRVLIVGAGGSGKSTLARALAAGTGLPVIHLDHHYWRPGWDPTPDDEWREQVCELIAGDQWIIDGNYGGTLDLRVAACDTLIFLDLPVLASLTGIVRRRVARRSPRQALGCPNKLDAEFVRWVVTYRRRSRPRVLAFAASPRTFAFVHLRSRTAIRHYLRSHEAE